MLIVEHGLFSIRRQVVNDLVYAAVQALAPSTPPFETFEEVAKSLPSFIDPFYNSRRLHSAPGYLQPGAGSRRPAEGVKTAS